MLFRSFISQSTMDKDNENISSLIDLFFDLHSSSSRKVLKRIFGFYNIVLKGILEFLGDARPRSFQIANYNLYSYGGMKFLLISSSMFLLVNSIVLSKYYFLVPYSLDVYDCLLFTILMCSTS